MRSMFLLLTCLAAAACSKGPDLKARLTAECQTAIDRSVSPLDLQSCTEQLYSARIGAPAAIPCTADGKAAFCLVQDDGGIRYTFSGSTRWHNVTPEDDMRTVVVY